MSDASWYERHARLLAFEDLAALVRALPASDFVDRIKLRIEWMMIWDQPTAADLIRAGATPEEALRAVDRIDADTRRRLGLVGN